MATPTGNALILHRLDSIETKLDATLTVLEKLGERCVATEKQLGVNVEKISNLRKDVNDLETKSDRWNVGNSIVASVAAIIAAVGWGK